MAGKSVQGLSLALLASAAHAAPAKVAIEAMKHNTQPINPGNFDGVVSKFRETTASSVWYYHSDSAADGKFFEEYEKVATDMKGMVKTTALDCTEHPKFCKKQGVTSTPHVQMYPIVPMPAFKFEGKLEAKPLSSQLARMVPDLSTKLTTETVDAWLTTDSSKPKLLLFSNKKSPPTMWKALSTDTVFKRSVKFGFVTEEDKDLVQRFKVTKFPTILRQVGTKKPDKYAGELTFLALKEWAGVHSESGMGDKVGVGAKEDVSIEESKPWLVQDVPELTSKSHNDVCFKGEGLCVIYLTDGVLSQAETEMLKGQSNKFTSQLSDRGAKMKWMWMNTAVETQYKELFEPARLPSAVVFNPHKRLRFTKLDHGEDNEVAGDATGIANLMDKVLGGDARFKMVPGQKLPSWAVREEKKKTEL